MTLENVLRGSGDIGAMLATCWGLSKIDTDKAQVYFTCVKDRDFRETPRPFVIEGRPHLDEKGKFKMLQTPGNAPDYAKLKQAERGRAGGRPKVEPPEEVKMKVWETAQERPVTPRDRRGHRSQQEQGRRDRHR